MAKTIEFKLEAINRDFNRAIDNSLKKTENLQANLSKVAKVSGVAFAGLAAAIGGVVSQASKIEDITTQFEVLTGSVNGANKAVAQLQEFSASTPFSFEQVANAGKQLLAFGFSVDEITTKLNEVGDVAAASGKDVGELTTIYGQVAAAGKLTGERLNQLQEAAVPIGPALANALGVAESSVRTLVSQGKVDFATFEQAFKSLSQEGGFAFGGLEKASQTLSGQISTVKDNFALIASEIGQAFLPILKQAATALLGFLEEIRNDPALIEQAQRFLKIGVVVTGLTAAIAGLAIGFVKLKAALAGVTVLLGAIASPIVLIKVAIAGLIGAVVALASGWDSNLSFIENFTVLFVNRIKTLFSGLATVIKGAFDLDVDTIKSGLAEAKTAFASTNAELEEQRNEVLQKRKERAEQEIQAEKEKNERLAQEEIRANEAKLARDQEQALLKQEQQRIEGEQKRLINEELAALEREQQIQLNEQERQQLTEFLAAQKSDRIANFQAALNARKKTRQEELEIEKKFGKDFLAFKKAIDSEEFRAAESLARQNINLQRSSNRTLSTIGKTSAIVDIGTQAARGAMAAFANAVAAFPPPFGPALGAGLAAAQIAYGAEQIARVRRANDGALVEGRGGIDNNPFMLSKGELVVPRKNFDDVVTDAANRRLQEQGESDSVSGGVREVIIGFADDAFEIIEQKLLERRALGVGNL